MVPYKSSFLGQFNERRHLMTSTSQYSYESHPLSVIFPHTSNILVPIYVMQSVIHFRISQTNLFAKAYPI